MLTELQIETIIAETCGTYRTGGSYTFEDVWNCIEKALAAHSAGAQVTNVHMCALCGSTGDCKAKDPRLLNDCQGAWYRPAAQEPQAAEPKGEPAAWINYPCNTENGEFAGHGEPELTFKRQAYGYDLAKAEPLYRAAEPLYRAAEPKGMTALLRANHLRRCDALSDVGFEIETEAGAVVVLTFDMLRALLAKGE